ncbi:MAG: ornithine carbamoyltransferase [Aigarchaeota archaeon]|nr:ornithine carbamoyltransferase [Aigarchaeota archaeon]MCX8193501.1 ornithine carbamoyltransferase [Nitrososphaeria archaeon]MDW7986804.1 ornithine carbamoyltransferase [Nitrososphaerota archaeon]
MSFEIGYISKKKFNFKGRDFLELQDFSAEEIWKILKTTSILKKRRVKVRKLRGKSVAMIFEKPSTRTRVSFEVAVEELGGKAIYLTRSELQLGRGETIADTARVLSRYVHLIMARVYKYETLEELARYATIPVVNGLSDINHPLQTLADLYTIWEKFKKLRGLTIAWVGDGSNVCNSLLIGASKLGVNVNVATPPGYEPHPKYIEWAEVNARQSNSSIKIMHEPEEAVVDADVIMTDVFVSMGQEEEREKRLSVFYPKYQVNSELVSKAKSGVVFMHPLPAHRGEEVTDEVIDSSYSLVWDQAENRLHTSKALLYLLL